MKRKPSQILFFSGFNSPIRMEPRLFWPPCKDSPKDKYCDFRTEFDYTVQVQPDGSFKILDTLPYSLWLDQ